MTDFDESISTAAGAAGNPAEPSAEAACDESEAPGVELHRMSRRLGEKIRHARGTTGRILWLMD